MAAPPVVRPHIPRLLYGTAWKRERTADLVYAALAAGFRGLDTAAQPRHYREDLVADGVRRALRDRLVPARADLYIQTKFTLPGGQDWGDDDDGDSDGDGKAEPRRRPPYDRDAPIAEQARASVQASLRAFSFGAEDAETDAGDADGADGAATAGYIDCLVLHSPPATLAEMRAVWAALAAFVPHRVRSLGISNVDLPGLEAVVDVARTLWRQRRRDAGGPADADDDADDDDSSNPFFPAVVQNRFHGRAPGDPYDAALRRFCRAGGAASPSPSPGRRPIVYQAFWTLTANRGLVRRAPCVAAVAAGAQVAPEVAFYSLVLALGEGEGTGAGAGAGAGAGEGEGANAGARGMAILDGTTSQEHMAADLAGLAKVDAWRTAVAAPGPATWAAALAEFRHLVGDD